MTRRFFKFKFPLIIISLSLIITNFLRHILFKALNLIITMNNNYPFFYSSSSSWGDDDDGNTLFSSSTTVDKYSGPIKSLADLGDERLYLVDYNWWNETREAVFEGVVGVEYVASCSGFCDEFEDEFVLDMSLSGGGGGGGEDCDGEEGGSGGDGENCDQEEGGSGCSGSGGSGREYALVSEWMFYRTLKWHYDRKNDVQNMVATDYNKADLFPLQVTLSISGTSSLVVKISRKENMFGAFNRSYRIFNVNSGMLKIWDFSGQITKFFLQSKMVHDSFDLLNKEISLELQVFGLSYDIMLKENVMAVEDSKTELKVNGHSDNVKSYVSLGQLPHKVRSYVSLGQLPHAGSFNEPYKLGLTGLYNLGNTCYMNSAIQCLVHTPQIVDYFLGDFRKDLNFENPLGMNGKLALAFGDMLRQLWTPDTTSVGPRAFKSTLVGFAPQFGGYNQHDSQEFLAFLLDGLHEDLNCVKVKPYNEIKDVDAISHKEAADEHWKNHLARNDSIIVDLCQGQYRSTLICPICKKESVTFDPFLYLSLPLPIPPTTMRTMTLTVLTDDGSTLPELVTFDVPKFGKLKDLIQALSTACSLRDDETLLVAEIYNNRIFRFFDRPSDSLTDVRDNDKLVAYRLPKDQDSLPLVVFIHSHFEEYVIRSKGQGGLRRFGIQPRGFGIQPRGFGIPLVARIPECSDSFELRKKFLQLLNPFVMPEELSSDSLDDDTVNNAEQDIGMDADVEIDDVSSSDEVKEKSIVQEDFQFSLVEKEWFNITRSKVILVSWSDEVLKLYNTRLLNRLPETGATALLANNPPELVSLSKCLEAFLKEEPLGPEDMWYCPTCKEHQQASKKLDLWRLPEVLIIHLKRFSYNRFLKDKLDTFVDFPVDDFDLSDYTVHKSSHRYKLYAVSNHYGGVGGGHYTAFAQCGEQWFEFNDSQVFPISEDQIKTPAAYVLFYKRI